MKHSIMVRFTLLLILVIASSASADDPCYSRGEPDHSCEGCSCGNCDSYAERTLWTPSVINPMIIKTKMIVLAEDNFANPAVSPTIRSAQIERLNEDFEDYGIFFDVDPVVINDTCLRHMCNPTYATYCTSIFFSTAGPMCCDANSPQLGCEFEEYQDVMMKNLYADEGKLNIFITQWQGGSAYGIYPWRDRALTKTGGVMIEPSLMDNTICTGGHCTWLTHEVGHALGLWHTWGPDIQLGVGCECSELANSCMGSENCNDCGETGDMCCDTPAAQGPASCSTPEGYDSCDDDAPYPESDYSNYMDYGGDGCADHFTPEQARRMHCWVCDRLPDWIDSPDCNENEMPDVCDITRGDSEDCDENGVPDDCQWMPQRACCYDSSCGIMKECECDDLGGTFLGLVTSCSGAPCAMPP